MEKGGAGTRLGGKLTALVARVTAWAGGRRLGRGAGTSVTAHGLSLSSGELGERGMTETKGDNSLLPCEGGKFVFIEYPRCERHNVIYRSKKEGQRSKDQSETRERTETSE